MAVVDKNSSNDEKVRDVFGCEEKLMDTEQCERQKLIGREFRHFKGGHYRLEGFAKDSETLEGMVVYRALYGEGGLWVRPARMFFETIERDGKTFRRFELV